MKTLKTICNENIPNSLHLLLEDTSEVKNRKLKQLLAKEGLDKIILCKDYGYFYIASDNDEWANKIAGMYENAIYMNSFNQQTPEEWVEDIKRLLKQNGILESLLDNVDDTISAGDAIVANIEMDFNKLRKMIADKPAWKLHNRKTFNSHHQFVNNGIECPNLMAYLGYKQLNCLQINIDRDVIKGEWFIRFFGFHNRGGVKVTNCVSTESKLTGNSKLPDVLKFIDSKTKDIDTLKKFLEENKR